MPTTTSVLRSSCFSAFVLLACGCQPAGTPVPQPGTVALEAPAESTAGLRDSAEAPADVIHAYYRAITERRYGDAYALWASEGVASGKSFEAFRAGFDSTASVDVVPGTPGPMEGAAGSRYIEIPVRITTVAKDGERQEFSGTYTLRRSVVDGATPAQRAWKIHSAKIRREG